MDPSHPLYASAILGFYREGDILRMLAQGLDDRFDGSHMLRWSGMHGEQQHFGEYNFVNVSPCGQLLILDIKAGGVAQGDNGLTKPYGAERHRLLPPITKSNQALRRFFGVSAVHRTQAPPKKQKNRRLVRGSAAIGAIGAIARRQRPHAPARFNLA
jgi:hypothetical protein